MFYSNITAYFIILATAVTLNVGGNYRHQYGGAAASALRPLAGDFAYTLFALGILGVGLTRTCGCRFCGLCLSEAMGWKWGLETQATMLADSMAS